MAIFNRYVNARFLHEVVPEVEVVVHRTRVYLEVFESVLFEKFHRAFKGMCVCVCVCVCFVVGGGGSGGCGGSGW